MKVLSVVAVLLVTITVFSEGKRHDEYKLEKKSSIHMNVKKPHHSHHKMHKDRLRGSHLDMKEGGVTSMFDHKWMKPPKNTECKLKCGHKEFCISNPGTGEEKCISKRNFKESRRLFRSFHKEKDVLKNDRKNDRKSDFLDKELGRAEEMKDVYDLIHDYNKKRADKKKIHIKTVKDLDMEKFANEAVANTAQECRPTELYELRKRMVGWFVLMHTESRREHHKMKHKKHGRKHHKKHHFMFMDKDYGLDMKKSDLKKSLRGKRAVVDMVSTESHKHCKCSKSAMWEFRKQDKDRNRILGEKEMEMMSANRREPCMKPLFKSCDTDKDGALTHGEWCCCMAYTIPPCLEKKRLTDPKVWVPRCDKEGYYEREQCHDNSGYCWCVDINGNEIVGTKKLGGGHCGQYDPNGHKDVKKL
ncbi:uncharacterized protein LOC123563726 [Mercenaria mercenaria]|uniref:uncharacterized protein LOC123563726 n=1 Tax=Mercenaria mercenaria TaxID=6596 RepID=UPI001E1D68C8|nr:uncharacterized protein LOC123563726 [Mercenaria mercenaria]